MLPRELQIEVLSSLNPLTSAAHPPFETFVRSYPCHIVLRSRTQESSALGVTPAPTTSVTCRSENLFDFDLPPSHGCLPYIPSRLHVLVGQATMHIMIELAAAADILSRHIIYCLSRLQLHNSTVSHSDTPGSYHFFHYCW